MANKLAKLRLAARAFTLSKTLTIAVSAAEWALTALIFITTSVSFGQSYHGLLIFSTDYLHESPPWNWTWPLMVDAFLAGGEIGLFIIAAKGEKSWHVRGWLWALTSVGLLASLAGNIAHDGLNVPHVQMAGNAVPPIAAAAMLGVGLGFLKREVARLGTFQQPAAAPKVTPVRVIEAPAATVTPITARASSGRAQLTPSGRLPKGALQSNDRVRGIVREVSSLMRAGRAFSVRGIHDEYNVSRHIAKQILERAQVEETARVEREARNG
jgi:hypothetical protein